MMEAYKRIMVASLPDLSAMILDTLIGRGTKRDFIDVYYLSQKYGLVGLFIFYQRKYDNFEERKLLLKPLLEKIASKYLMVDPDTQVIIQGGSSSVGIKAAANGN